MLTDATRTCGELISVQFLMFADYFSLVYFILTYGVRYKNATTDATRIICHFFVIRDVKRICSFDYFNLNIISDICISEALNFVDDSIDVCTHYIS